MKNCISFILLICLGISCSQNPDPKKVLANQILSDSSFFTVDTMARNILKKGFNAGSGYSQVWARDMNTFVEIALETVNPKDIRGAILVFFALQQPNNEMIDGYVLNKDFKGYKEDMKQLLELKTIIYNLRKSKTIGWLVKLGLIHKF